MIDFEKYLNDLSTDEMFFILIESGFVECESFPEHICVYCPYYDTSSCKKNRLAKKKIERTGLLFRKIA